MSSNDDKQKNIYCILYISSVSNDIGAGLSTTCVTGKFLWCQVFSSSVFICFVFFGCYIRVRRPTQMPSTIFSPEKHECQVYFYGWIWYYSMIHKYHTYHMLELHVRDNMP